MKKLILILALVSLTGCALIQAQKDNWEACKQDIECSEKAKNYQTTAETVSTVVASAIPVPGAAAAPKVIGYIALAFAMLTGGAAVNKKKKNAAV